MRRLVALFVIVAVAASCSPVTLARRLLMAPSGSGFILPRVPPTDASWSRSGSNPIMSPAVAWEETAVEEPRVVYDAAHGWRMWYTGGWTHPAMGYATSVDGITWTKYASNPVYGQGGSGYANTADCPEVVIVGSTLYLFTSGGVDTTHPFTTFRVATSTDGIAWTTQSSSITIPSGKTLWGNRTVWVEGSTWYMLQEAGPSPWEIYLYTSSDGLTWTIGNGGSPLTSLQVHAGGAYGGPSVYANDRGEQVPKIGSTYQIWYHAAPGSGNTPSNIYHATSSDLINWTITSPSPVLTHTGSGDELDQIADPNIVVVGTTAWLYYDAVINATSTGKLMLATAPGILP